MKINGMKMKNFELNENGTEVKAVIETAYFSASVSLLKDGRKTKWKFGVKSLTPNYKSNVKSILKKALESKTLPMKGLRVPANA